jgi:hypothetical protein
MILYFLGSKSSKWHIPSEAYTQVSGKSGQNYPSRKAVSRTHDFGRSATELV